MQDGLVLWLVKLAQLMIKYKDKMELLCDGIGDY